MIPEGIYASKRKHIKVLKVFRIFVYKIYILGPKPQSGAPSKAQKSKEPRFIDDESSSSDEEWIDYRTYGNPPDQQRLPQTQPALTSAQNQALSTSAETQTGSTSA